MSDIDAKVPVRFKDYLAEMKESASILTWIWQEMVGVEGRKVLKRLLLTIIVVVFLLALQPLAFSQVILTAQQPNLATLMLAFGVMALLGVLQMGSSLVQELTRESAWNSIWFNKQTRIDKLFGEKSLGEHSDEGSKLNSTTIERAKSRMQGILEMMLFESGSMFVQIIFTYSFLWYLSIANNSIVLGAAATALISIHVAWSLYLNYHVSKETDAIEKEMRAHGRQLIERWEKIARVKTNGKTDSEHERLSSWLKDILRQDKAFWFWFIKQAFFRDAIMYVIRMSLIGFGAYMVQRGEWKVGMLLPLYVWLTDLCSNLKWIGQTERRINQQLPYIKAMRDVLMAPAAFAHDTGVFISDDCPLKVHFENVGLAYEDGGSNAILKDLNFTLYPADKVALIGPSGAGKTSIMKLVLRHMDPTEGRIYVNDVLLTDINHQSYMEHLGYIPQQPEVFDGTIRYNLTFGLTKERQRSITDEEIWTVMRLLHIDFGKRLTHGLDTKVGKDGMKLSGGQAQRLMIGAAVIKNPKKMIIDEATSSLDSVTELGVQAGLEEALSENVGALIVAHRLSTVREICNKFIVLRPIEDIPQGGSQIEAEGSSFEELYELSPTFRALADAQGIVMHANAIT